MYKVHMPLIRDAALENYGIFKDVVTFTLLSIRQPFLRVPEQMDEVRVAGAKSAHLWGWKRDGYEFLQTGFGIEVWTDIRAISRQRQWAEADALYVLAKVPGLGIVKSGFVAQMLGFDVACFDSRNMKFLGIEKRKFRYDYDYSKGLLLYKIGEYVELSRKTGGAEYWWNRWCASVAADNHEIAERVSYLHLAAIRKGVR